MTRMEEVKAAGAFQAAGLGLLAPLKKLIEDHRYVTNCCCSAVVAGKLTTTYCRC